MSAIVYTINMNTRIVKIAQLANDKAPFIEWMNSLEKNTKISFIFHSIEKKQLSKQQQFKEKL